MNYKVQFVLKWSNFWIFYKNKKELNEAFVKELDLVIENEVKEFIKKAKNNDS